MKHVGATSAGKDIATQDQLGGGASLVKGSATLNFGTAGNDMATVTQLAPSLTAAEQIVVRLSPLGTVDNDADEHFVEPAVPKVTARVDGVSFNISMASTDSGKLFGTWLVDWALI